MKEHEKAQKEIWPAEKPCGEVDCVQDPERQYNRQEKYAASPNAGRKELDGGESSDDEA
jgi:hypothetical protein